MFGSPGPVCCSGDTPWVRGMQPGCPQLFPGSASFPGGGSCRVAGLWDGSTQSSPELPLQRPLPEAGPLGGAGHRFFPLLPVHRCLETAAITPCHLSWKGLVCSCFWRVCFVFGASSVDCCFTLDSLQSSQAFLEQHSLIWTQCSLCGLSQSTLRSRIASQHSTKSVYRRSKNADPALGGPQLTSGLSPACSPASTALCTSLFIS